MEQIKDNFYAINSRNDTIELIKFTRQKKVINFINYLF